MSDTYTTSQGFKIEFRAIPRTIQKFQLAHPQPEPPMYDTPKTATGIVEHYPLDEKTATTPEEKEQLAQYQTKLSEHAEKFLNVCFIKGIIVHADMQEWIDEQKELEIPVPENPTERKIEWLLDRIVSTEEDFRQITLGVMKASGAPEELLTQIESLFRGEVGESNGNGTDKTSGTNIGAELVLQPILRGEPDSIRDGDTKKSIRPMEEIRQTKRTRRTQNQV